MAPPRGLAALLALAAVLAIAGCGGDATDDSKIIAALNLKEAGNGYEMNGDPFCRVDEVLNDTGEVEEAGDKKDITFVIAAPKGEFGVVARPPFAPSCKREATEALKRLANPPKKKAKK
jgi:hypothetical protein